MMSEKKERREFSHAGLGCKFTLPATWTLGDVYAFDLGVFDAVAAEAQGGFSQNYIGTLAVLDDWECETLPDPHAITDEIMQASGDVIKIIVWVGGIGRRERDAATEVPKN